jgi:hypothetical protein
MTKTQIGARSMKSTQQVEFENEFEDLRRKWLAFHEEGVAMDLSALVQDTQRLERTLGAAPGTLLNKLRKNGNP